MADVATQLADLQAEYRTAQATQRADGSILIQLPDISLPPGWNQDRVTITFVAPVGYPMARPDCFWADANLRLANGAGMPANTGVNSNYGGAEQLLWFSYHPSTWNSNQDTLLTYIRLIRRRLSEVR